jgi:hypothetical protein
LIEKVLWINVEVRRLESVWQWRRRSGGDETRIGGVADEGTNLTTSLSHEQPNFYTGC